MRPNNGELYEDWCYRARMYEHGIAMQRIAKGENVEIVLEEMSQRLLRKLIHPLYEITETEFDINFNKEKSKLEYKENYLNKMNPVADHVDRDS